MSTATKTKTPQEIAALAHKYILRHPDRHDQDVWATAPWMEEYDQFSDDESFPLLDGQWIEATCTSTACCAGWVVTLAGDKMLIDPREGWAGAAVPCAQVRTQDGKVKRIDVRAQELLGISGLEAVWLFAGERTRREVLRGLLLLSRGEHASFTTLVNKYYGYDG
jgi:hypothetical protein